MSRARILDADVLTVDGSASHGQASLSESIDEFLFGSTMDVEALGKAHCRQS